jgi:tetratricopeptide (TPR) repeat protein
MKGSHLEVLAMSRRRPLLAIVALVAGAGADQPLPLCGLGPARVTPELCTLHYPLATASADCQRLFDQGLAHFYSYSWMEAARAFETAARCDADCALAWWGLSRALDKWPGHDAQHRRALTRAKELLPRVSHRDAQLIRARLVEFGLADVPPPTAPAPSGPADTSADDEPPPPPNEGDRAKRRRAAARILDELLALHDDDTEAWFCRAQLADGPGRVPYFKALLHVDPLHPGAHHELVHFYEGARRPALGWVHAEKYIASSPGLPHSWHMQAHLATRLGKWDHTSDRSARAIALHRAYHRAMKVAPKDDQQYSHHLEILTASLIHDGRFREARDAMAEAKAAGLQHTEAWFRLFVAERDWSAALQLAEETRKSDKAQAAYYAALVHLARGDTAAAMPQVEVVQEAARRRGTVKRLAYRAWETRGLLLCQTGAADEGLRLLERAAQESKDDYGHHSWGNGAVHMEAWGRAALAAGRDDVAEEAFLEALAHDPGSVRAALGLQVLCSRQGRADEARRYEEMARRCWSRAEVRAFDALTQEVAAGAPKADVASGAGRE